MINLFMHIPKTAGTTLRSIVDAQYGPRRVLTYYNQVNTALIDNLGPYLRTKPFDAMIGHFPFGVHSAAPDGYRYYTFLREPLALVMSTYGEVMKAAGPTQIPEVAAQQLDLATSLDRFAGYFSNIQTRYILSLGAESPLPPDALAQACARLEDDFALVGTAERFNESILLIAKQLGWRPCIYRNMNVGSGAVLDGELRTRVARMNEIDTQLHLWASERLDALCRGAGDVFAAAAEELQTALIAADDGKRAHYQAARIAVDELPTVHRYLSAG